MKIVYSTFLQVTIISGVMALSFDSIIKSLPADIPEDFKNMIKDLFSKHHPDMSDTDSVPEKNLQIIHDNLTQNSILESNLNKSTMESTTVADDMVKQIMNNRRSEDVSTQASVVMTQPPPPTVLTEKPVYKLQRNKSSVPPPMLMLPPHPMPLPLPMPVPIYANVPFMLPMKTYFEPVVHDHPPLYKIREIIKKDEAKWGKHNKEADCDYSFYRIPPDTDTDTDTDTSKSEYVDVGSEYYDSFFRIIAGEHN